MSGAHATPASRKASHSQVARYQRVAAATAGSCRSTQSAAGRPPSAQPRTPVAAVRSSASAVARVSSQVIAVAGRLAAVVDRDERGAVAVDADRDDLAGS